ncbi:hypothetical protein KC723_02570 [Candidatus Kaiserbacteria bacterium]|nr:hypothetical protein [Candidatus Kaiserbacteria bacterium]
MILDPMVNFWIFVLVQFTFFVLVAFHLNKADKIIKYLLLGLIIGLPFGVAFDLLIGEYVGVFSYYLGFTKDFVIINAVLSYGLLISTVALIKNLKIISLYLWSVLIACVYELINYLSPVWEWTFGGFLYELVVVIGAAYFGLMLLMILVIKAVGFKNK